MINSNSKILVGTLKKEKQARVPFWFMRQAGRYLPEYRELRSKAKNFLDFCYTPDMAVEATLQPIRRFGMDAAIIFSDILVIPHALGVDVRFEENVGPVLAPVQDEEGFKKLSMQDMDRRLKPVYEALRQTRKKLDPDKTLIGFCGSPWTLACYMVQGKSDQNFSAVRNIGEHQNHFFNALIKLLSDSVAQHAIRQIDAGADVIQLFDSWSGVLNEKQFSDWVIKPTADIVKTIQKKYPSVPIIGFPRQSGSKYKNYIRETGINAVNIDSSTPLDWVKNELQPHCVVQGCLDPILLADNKSEMLKQAEEIVVSLRDKPFVFNLGHGILPHTPVEHVQALCDFLRHSAATP